MKISIVISMALAMGLALAPLAEATANTTGVETLATAKKKTVKKTVKKTKTTVKKDSTTTKKATTTKKKCATDATTGASTLTDNTTKTDSKAKTSNTAEVGNTAKTATETSSSSRGGLLGGIISAIGGGSKEGSLLSGLSTIFDATKGATKDRIIGSWTYSEPAVVFSSKNVLSSIGGKVAAQAIEKKLQTQFDKAGIKKTPVRDKEMLKKQGKKLVV